MRAILAAFWLLVVVIAAQAAGGHAAPRSLENVIPAAGSPVASTGPVPSMASGNLSRATEAPLGSAGLAASPSMLAASPPPPAGHVRPPGNRPWAGPTPRPRPGSGAPG